MPPKVPTQGKALTMEQLANVAGVSKMTVSLALRGHPKISVATRERIRALAEEMGYRPNPLVQTLMANLRTTHPTSYHSTIAWVTTFPTHDGWNQHHTHQLYHQGASARAAALGYKIEPFWAFAPRMTGAILSRMFRARGIRGLIVPPAGRPGTKLDIEWEHFSCATIGYSLVEPCLNRAAANLNDGMNRALAECTRRGLRRVAFAVPVDTDARVNHAWLAAFLAWQNFIPAKDRIPPLLAENPMQERLPVWIGKHRPEVIISPNNEFTHWLPTLGLRIPRDIGLVVLSAYGNSAGHNLSGIDQNDFSVGAAAVDLIVSQIQHNEVGIPEHARQILINGTWKEGSTLGEERAVASSARPAAKRRSSAPKKLRATAGA
ncbi:MAG: LacI family DNA-binding transcriptional regulator [Verrucomicrobiota bacterium]